MGAKELIVESREMWRRDNTIDVNELEKGNTIIWAIRMDNSLRSTGQ